MEKKTFKRYDRENVMLTGCERKHAYLIMAHKDDYTFRTLLPMLDDPRNDIFIHMDVKSRQFDRNDVIDSLSYSKCFFTRRTNVDLRIPVQGIWNPIPFGERVFVGRRYVQHRLLSIVKAPGRYRIWKRLCSAGETAVYFSMSFYPATVD